MIQWILLMVLQLFLTMIALIASGAARNWARYGWFEHAEAAGTLSFCLFVILGVVFLCLASSRLTVFSLVLAGIWVVLALRDWCFVKRLTA